MIVAEVGVNWNGSWALAQELILLARECGVGTVKFQLYEVDKLFPDKRIIVSGRNWYELVKKTELTRGQVNELATLCDKLSLEFMASAFDLERLEWLKEVGVQRYKVGTRFKSKEVMEAIAQTGKPVLVSLELYDHEYWRGICQHYFGNRCQFLYCVPNYPTRVWEFQFDRIGFGDNLDTEFQGLSSHYPGIAPALYALAHGAEVVEVHFTKSRLLLGPDQTSSIEPEELKQLVMLASQITALREAQK